MNLVQVEYHDSEPRIVIQQFCAHVCVFYLWLKNFNSICTHSCLRDLAMIYRLMIWMCIYFRYICVCILAINLTSVSFVGDISVSGVISSTIVSQFIQRRKTISASIVERTLLVNTLL